MKTTTLATAILLVLKKFKNIKKTFSVYEVTTEIRQMVNSKTISLSDVDMMNSDPTVNNVRHTEVRSLFRDFFDNGVLESLEIDPTNAEYYNLFRFVDTQTNSQTTPQSTPAFQPTQSQPTQSQPTQSQPTQSQPAQSQPAQSQPAQSQAVYTTKTVFPPSNITLKKRTVSKIISLPHDKAKAKDQIVKYLSSKRLKREVPTLKNCQSAVHRVASVPINEIEDWLTSLGYRVFDQSGKKHSLALIY